MRGEISTSSIDASFDFWINHLSKNKIIYFFVDIRSNIKKLISAVDII